jgi:hypothetical protein
MTKPSLDPHKIISAARDAMDAERRLLQVAGKSGTVRYAALRTSSDSLGYLMLTNILDRLEGNPVKFPRNLVALGGNGDIGPKRPSGEE